MPIPSDAAGLGWDRAVLQMENSAVPAPVPPRACVDGSACPAPLRCHLSCHLRCHLWGTEGGVGGSIWESRVCGGRHPPPGAARRPVTVIGNGPGMAALSPAGERTPTRGVREGAWIHTRNVTGGMDTDPRCHRQGNGCTAGVSPEGE